jgi:predicted nucleotidyltransferase
MKSFAKLDNMGNDHEEDTGSRVGMKNPEQITEAIRRTLEKDGRVVLCYLFGSMARGETGPLSDVDIGVLFLRDSDAAHGELMDSLCRALQTDRVDLVLLNQAPMPLRYRVIQDGKLLHCVDNRLRERFESETVMHYLDFKPLRDAAFRTAHGVIVGTE